MKGNRVKNYYEIFGDFIYLACYLGTFLGFLFALPICIENFGLLLTVASISLGVLLHLFFRVSVVFLILLIIGAFNFGLFMPIVLISLGVFLGAASGLLAGLLPGLVAVGLVWIIATVFERFLGNDRKE